jgi:hypothetical protein
MSGTDEGASTGGALYDQAGNRIAGTAQRELEPLVRFARDQPYTMTILALGIGYLMAKVL